MTLFTRMIQVKRMEAGESFEKLAKALKISPAFAKHLVYSDIVPVSPRLVEGLARRYGIPKKRLALLAEHRNRIGRAYYRKYRAKNS